MRYNIALLAKFPNSFIQEAQKLFGTIAQGYLLSPTSLPHITLAQFYVDNKEQLVDIWQQVQQKITTISQPQFIGINLTKKAKDFWGISLMVARDPDLVACHRMVLAILKQYNIPCISDSEELYRPHLTLARIKEPKITNFNDRLLETISFVLALGQADENGQYLRTIFKQN